MAGQHNCLFIGDLIERGLHQGSCIRNEQLLSISDIKYVNDTFEIEMDVCSKLNQSELGKEYIYVVIGINFEFITKNDTTIHGSLSADVVGGKKFTTNLVKESSHLDGKFKINQYQLIPIELLNVLHANVSKVKNQKKHVPERKHLHSYEELESMDLIQRLNNCVEKADELVRNSEVLTINEKHDLTSLQATLLNQKDNIFMDSCYNIEELNWMNWVSRLYSFLNGLDKCKGLVENRSQYLEAVVKENEERLKFVSVLINIGVVYVNEAEIFNSAINKEDCFVLFFNKESVEKDQENYDKTFQFFKKFVETSKNEKVDQIFLVFDTDFVSKDKLTVADVPNDVLVYHISKSEILSRNLMNDLNQVNSLNIATSKKRRDGHKLNKRVRFMMPCPKSQCSNDFREWLCDNCGTYLDYGYNRNALYCNCCCFSGKGTYLKNFQFRCKDSNHGFYFVDFIPKFRFFDLSPVDPSENITILIAGQTCVGKTTFIKAMISTLAFENYKETNQKIEDLDDIKIDETKKCRMYSIRFKNYNVQFIDTPGFGKSVDVDAKNAEAILNYISFCKRLHAVCILTKSYEWEKKIIPQKFHIKQILSFFHQNLAKNIVFCTTYFPSLSLEPINSSRVLKEIIAENKSMSLINPLTFNFDVEFYDHIKNQTTNVSISEIENQMSPEERSIFQKGWDKTSNETTRFLDHVVALEPQDLDETMALKKSRQKISTAVSSVSQVIGGIKQNISTAVNVRKIVYSINTLSNTGRKDLPENICTDEYCVQYFQSDLPVNESKCSCTEKCLAKRTDIVTEAIHCNWKTHVFVYSPIEDQETDIRIISEGFELTVRSRGNPGAIGNIFKNLDNFRKRGRKYD